MKLSGNIFSILVLFLCAACNSKDEPEPLSSEQFSVLNYLPKKSEFVLYMNLNLLRQTDFWDNYFSKSIDNFEQQKWLNEFESATGVGINSGTAEIYLSTSWNNDNVFVIKFDKNYNKIKEYFETSYKTFHNGSKKIFYSEENPAAQFYFPSDFTMIIANSRQLITSITSNEFNSILNDPEMMHAIENTKWKKYYWMATDNAKDFAAAFFTQYFVAGEKERTEKILRSVENISLSASFDEEASLSSELQLVNESDAFLLSTSIRSMLGNELPNIIDIKLKKIIKKIKVNRDNKEVSLSFSLDQSDLGDIQKLSNQKQGMKNN